MGVLRRSWGRDLLAAATLAAGVLVLTASVISGKRSMLSGFDNSVQSYAWYAFGAREGALWDPNQWNGHTFVGELITSLLYLPQELLFLATGPNITGRGITAFLIAHLLFAALSMYAFLRVLGLVRPGAVVGGLAFATGGYLVHRLPGQAQIFVSASWVPLIFCLFHLAVARALWIAAPAGGALALSLLAGHIQPPAYAILGLVAYGLWWAAAAERRGPAALRAGAALAIVLALGGSIAAVQLIPSLEYQDRAVRFISEPEPVPGDAKIPYETAGHKFLLEPEQITAFVSPSFAQVQDGRPYIGILTLLLAAVGLARMPRRWAVFWGGFLLLSLLYTMGHHAGVHRLAYELIPLLDKIREPVRALMLVHFALAVLAGYGAAALVEWRPRVRASTAVAAGLALAGAAALVVVLAKALDGRAPSGKGEGALVAAALAVAGVALIAGRALGRLGPAAAAVLCVGVMILDLGPSGQLLFDEVRNYDGVRNLEPHRYYRETDVVRFLRAQQPPFRVSNPARVLPPNAGDVHGFEMVQGHGASLTYETLELLNTGGAPPSRAHDLMNVRFAVAPGPVDGWREVMVSADGHGRVAENPQPQPRAWLARGWEVVPDWKDAYHRMLDERFPYRESVVLDAPPRRAGPAPPGGTARVIRQEPTRIEVVSEAAGPGVLVVGENFYPGWRAEVDGEETRILRADGFMRAVEVPAGRHVVSMSYRPTHWTLALVLTGGGAGIALGASVWGLLGARRRRVIGRRLRAAPGALAPSRLRGLLTARGAARAAPFAIALAAGAFFCAGALTALDRPGLQYDEMAFVNAALGADHPDQHFVQDRVGGVITKVFPYIGALKSWLYAPVFEAFGTSAETIRAPAVLLGLLAVALAFWLAVRLFGPWPAALLAVLLATDPVYATLAKADWGPIVVASVLRVGALLAYFALLRTRSLRWAWVLGALLLLGIFNKIDFVWFVASLGAAALAVHWRDLLAIARSRPAAAALPTASFLIALAFMAVTSILPAREIRSPSNTDTLAERIEHRWELFTATFDGTAVFGYTVGLPLDSTTPAPGIYVGAVVAALVAIAAALALRGRMPRQEVRLAAFFLVQVVVIAVFLVTTRQVGGAHHLIHLWPLLQLLVVALVVVAWRMRPRAARLALTGTALAVLAWLVVAQVGAWREYREAYADGDDFTFVWTPEIYELADRADAVATDVDAIVAADWGIGPQVFALEGWHVRHRLRDMPGDFAAAQGLAVPQLADAQLRGKRVLVMLHQDDDQVFRGSSRGVRRVIHELGPRARVREVYSGEVLRAYLVDDRPVGGG